MAGRAGYPRAIPPPGRLSGHGGSKRQKGVGMLYRVVHRTEYRYDAEVTASYSEAHLLPRELPHQSVLETNLAVDPTPSDRSGHIDYFGNHTTFFSVDAPHTVLTVLATSVVEARPPAAIPANAGPAWHGVSEALRRDPSLDPEGHVRALALDSPLVGISDAVRRYAAPSFTGDRPVAAAALDLCTRIHADFEYRPGSTSIATGVDEVLARRQGVCQDFAHLAIACLRAVGLPARYVSGYLETQPPPGREKLEGADASHAWASVFVPGHGWLDLDPTNDTVPDDRYVVTAWGRDYSDVAPIKGVIYSTGLTQELVVAVDVVRLTASLASGA
jgi:transglutaminase-like putative cysteine protease